MPLRFDLFFDDDFGYYRVRFWGDGVDTVRKVPETFWRELGYRTPGEPEQRFEKLAIQWAGREIDRLLLRFTTKPTRAKLTWLECAKLAAKENPDLIDPQSLERHENWRNNVERYLKETRQIDVTPEDIDIAFATAFRNWRKSTPAYRAQIPRWRTIKNELQYIRFVCRFALAWSRKTGCAAIRIHKLPQTLTDDSLQVALTEEEFGKLLGKATKETSSLLILGVTTMLRKSNLLGLRAEWIDAEKRWLTVDRHLVKGRVNQKRTLSVPVPQWTIDALAGRRDGYVFANPRTGKPFIWIYDRLTTLATKSGVRGFSLHDLRSTGISWLRRHGVDRSVVKVLAHHSLHGDVTDLYTHVFVEHLRESVAVFDTIRASHGW